MLFKNITALIPRRLVSTITSIDWILFATMLLTTGAGLVTMNSFSADSDFFTKQLLWLGVSVVAFFVLSTLDFRFLRRTGVVVTLYVLAVVMLALLFVLGSTIKGAQSWFTIFGFTIQPVEPAKVILIIVLAKYFTRRHIEIVHIRHILVSGAYAFAVFALVFLQPDFGSALIIAAIWLGMVLVAGISKRHLLALILVGAVSFIGMWSYVLEDYQKQRITSFLHPLTDMQGANYNAYQSMVAVGSGQLLGKGVGYGTQSKLQFLPEHQTDFIFAAFTEEWGFVGAMVLFAVYGVMIWRIIAISMRGESNFETLYGIGVAVYFMAHVGIHVGMNLGLLPITGTTIPFMSYGGTHLLTEFAAVGILIGMSRYNRIAAGAGGELDAV